MKKYIIFLIAIGTLNEITCQTSFQVSSSLPIYLHNIAPGKTGDVNLHLFSSIRSPETYILNLNSNTTNASGLKLTIENNIFLGLASKYLNEGSNHFISLIGVPGEKNYFLKLDLFTKDVWIRELASSQFISDISIFDDKIEFLQSSSIPSAEDFSIISLDKNTGITDKKTGLKTTNFTPVINGVIEIQNIIKNEKKSIISFSVTDNLSFQKHSCIVQLDETGIISKKIMILNKSKIQLFKSPNNHIYVIGMDTETYPGIETKENTFIAKYDENLNLIWVRLYYADKFKFKRNTLSFTEDGSPILAYSTTGAYPTILGYLNTNGEIISEKGFALYEPKIHVSPGGSLYLMANRHFNSNGDVFFQNIIAKTDSLGKLDGCDTYDAILKSKEIIFKTGSFSIDTVSIRDLNWANGNIEPFQMEFEPFCDFPPPPNPNFNLKDTICVGECIRTDSTVGNRNAHGIEWVLEGKNLHKTVPDSLEFSHCFSEAGTYTLRQTIWFLGVDYSFEKIIEVLPPLEIEIINDEILCDKPPVNLELLSNRPIRMADWNTGDSSVHLQIFEGGNYSVLADDGFCIDSTEKDIDFIFEKIDSNLALQLPDTATACEILLPFRISPKSDFTTTFLNENNQTDSVFLLSKQGNHLFHSDVLGCRFSKNFYLKIDDCKANIFTPSAFSPNDDGINDTFLPFSPNIQPINLQIYNRWGGKVFESNDSSVEWNGNHNGKKIEQGVFVFRFVYVNLLTGLEEEISGDVAVVR